MSDAQEYHDAVVTASLFGRLQASPPVAMATLETDARGGAVVEVLLTDGTSREFQHTDAAFAVSDALAWVGAQG